MNDEVIKDDQYYRSKIGKIAHQIYVAQSNYDWEYARKLEQERGKLRVEYMAYQKAIREAAREKAIRDALAFAPFVLERANTLAYVRNPLDHQLRGGIQLATVDSGLLHDERGLGKTFTSQIWKDLLELKKILIITPRDVQTTFIKEYRKNNNGDPIRIVKLGQTNKGTREAVIDFMKDLPEFIFVINYEGLRRDDDLIKALVDLRFDGLICDESHNINKTKTKTYKSIAKIRFAQNWCPRHHDMYDPNDTYRAIGEDKLRCGETTLNEIEEPVKCGKILESTIKNTLMMTGTPILNRPQELYSMLHLIDATSFPTEASFLRDYCLNIGGSRWTFQEGGEERLFDKIGPRAVGRKRSDTNVEIPPQDIQVHEVLMEEENYPRQVELIRQIMEDALIQMGDEDFLTIPGVLAELTRLRQAITWPGGIKLLNGGYVIIRESAKMDAAEKLVKELVEEGLRVLVFSQFHAPLQELTDRINTWFEKTDDLPVCLEECAVVFDGTTSNNVKDKIIEDFGEDSLKEGYVPQYRVACANYKTGGAGLNLFGASQIVILDREWNPGKHDQAYGRVDRIGQTKQTSVHILEVANSIDSWMDELNQQKAGTVNAFNTAHKLRDAFVQKIMGWRK